MPRFPRNYLKTSFFHVMSQGINKNFIFEDSIDIKFYIKNMYEIKDKYNVNNFNYEENGISVDVNLDEEDYNIYKDYIKEIE